MKVYLDIITNHTADVIQYRECEGEPCPYRVARRLSVLAPGRVARRGRSTRVSPATACAAQRELRAADRSGLRLHALRAAGRGEREGARPGSIRLSTITTAATRTSGARARCIGDFVGLDDLMTENPRVVQGFIDIYGDWIERYGIDGFRIDTARHVNPEFWQAFVPAMLKRARGAAASRTSTSSAKWRRMASTWRSSRATRASTSCPRCWISGSPVRCQRSRRGQGGHRRCWRGCSRTMGCTKAARRRRCGCPRSSAITISAASRWLVRSARPRLSDDEVLQRVMLGECHVVPAARRAGGLLRRRAGLRRPRHRPGLRARTCSPARWRATTTRRCSARARTTAVANFDRAASAVPADRGAGVAARAVRRAAPRPAGRARAVAAAGIVRGFAHRQRWAARSSWSFNTSTAADQRAGGSRNRHALHSRRCTGNCRQPTHPARLKVELPPLGYVACAGGGAMRRGPCGAAASRCALLFAGVAGAQRGRQLSRPRCRSPDGAHRSAAARRSGRAARVLPSVAQRRADRRLVAARASSSPIAPKLERNFKISAVDAAQSSTTPGSSPGASGAPCATTTTRCASTLREKAGPRARRGVPRLRRRRGLPLRVSPTSRSSSRSNIVEELTEFAIAEPATAWWIPAGEWNRYEYLYHRTPLDRGRAGAHADHDEARERPAHGHPRGGAGRLFRHVAAPRRRAAPARPLLSPSSTGPKVARQRAVRHALAHAADRRRCAGPVHVAI